MTAALKTPLDPTPDFGRHGKGRMSEGFPVRRDWPAMALCGILFTVFAL